MGVEQGEAEMSTGSEYGDLLIQKHSLSAMHKMYFRCALGMKMETTRDHFFASI